MHTFYADTTADAQEVNENFTELDTKINAINRPIVGAYSGTRTPSIQSASAILTFTEETVDTADAFVHTTGIFTCPIAGLYFVMYSGYSDTSAGNGAIYIRKNSTNTYRVYSSSIGAYYNAMTVSGILDCAVDDTIDIYTDIVIHQNDGGYISIIYMGTA